MAGSREDSVLISLRALKGISIDREEEAREQERLRLEQARQALAEAERLRREDAERIVREAEAAKQRAADEAARVAREDALRLEEAERRARVEAAAALEMARLRMEVEARGTLRPRKRPVGLLLALGALVAGAAGLGVLAYRTSEGRRAAAAELRAAEAEAARQESLVDAARRDRAAKDRRIQELEGSRHGPIVEPPPRVIPSDPPVPPRPPRPQAVTRPPVQPALIICPEGKAICRPDEMIRK